MLRNMDICQNLTVPMTSHILNLRNCRSCLVDTIVILSVPNLFVELFQG
uniref:Uncharacterized protein n=1 Tax=Arundo donax TaxID=35708 RepID=A0A0A9FIH5_ARUDO